MTTQYFAFYYAEPYVVNVNHFLNEELTKSSVKLLFLKVIGPTFIDNALYSLNTLTFLTGSLL